jgi:hypothetical protein
VKGEATIKSQQRGLTWQLDAVVFVSPIREPLLTIVDAAVKDSEPAGQQKRSSADYVRLHQHIESSRSTYSDVHRQGHSRDQAIE